MCEEKRKGTRGEGGGLTEMSGKGEGLSDDSGCYVICDWSADSHGMARLMMTWDDDNEIEQRRNEN